MPGPGCCLSPPISSLRREPLRADTPSEARSVSSAVHCVESNLMRAHSILELDEETRVELNPAAHGS